MLAVCSSCSILRQYFSFHRYDEIIECCALAPDISVLPAGDQTEIGEKVSFKFLLFLINV